MPKKQRGSAHFPIFFQGVWEDASGEENEQRAKERGRWRSDTKALPEPALAILRSLQLHGRAVKTVFDLLGAREDDITYSLGWGLSRSEALARAMLGEAFGTDAAQGSLVAIRLQESETGTGRTEIETEHQHLVIEAKRGWTLPLPSSSPSTRSAYSRAMSAIVTSRSLPSALPTTRR